MNNRILLQHAACVLSRVRKYVSRESATNILHMIDFSELQSFNEKYYVVYFTARCKWGWVWLWNGSEEFMELVWSLSETADDQRHEWISKHATSLGIFKHCPVTRVRIYLDGRDITERIYERVMAV